MQIPRKLHRSYLWKKSQGQTYTEIHTHPQILQYPRRHLHNCVLLNNTNRVFTIQRETLAKCVCYICIQ